MPNPINQTKSIIIGLVGLCVVLLGSSIYFANRSGGQNSSINTSKSSTKNVEIDPNELTLAAIPAGYPQKLIGLKRNSNEGVTFNIAQKYEIPFEQRQNDPKVKYTPTNLPSGYFSRVTNSFGSFNYEARDILNSSSYDANSTIIANSFVLTKVEPKGSTNKVQSTSISHIYRNPSYDDKKNNTFKEGITSTGEFFQSIGAPSNIIEGNVVWFGSSNLPVQRIGNNHRHGVAIYNKNLNEKGLMGTYLRDYDTEIDTKISNQVCTNITFTQDNFICLNDYETLVNLNTGEEFGKYNQFIDTNDGYLYAKDVDNTMIYKVELNNPKNSTKIYSVKTGETISHFSYTSQKELLVQVTTSTPQPGILAPKITARTIELKPNGSILERPEFKDVRIFI